MQGKRERPLIPGFIYRIVGFDDCVIPVTARRGGLVFHRVLQDVHGKVFRGGRAPVQPDAEGRLCLDGEPTGRTLADLELTSEDEFSGLDALPMD